MSNIIRHLNHQLLKLASQLLAKILLRSPRGQWVYETNLNIESQAAVNNNNNFWRDQHFQLFSNKANLRDLIAATGLVILLKLDSNHQFFSPCDLEIWWMTLKKNRAPLLYYVKLCASFQIHRWIRNGVTVGKRSTQVKINNFLSPVTLKVDGWPWKIIGHLFYTTLSFVHHFKTMGDFKLELQSGNG